MGEADGNTKKEAEQTAAEIVLPLVSLDEIGDYILDSIDSISESMEQDGQSS